MSRTVHDGNNTGLDDGVKIASDLIGTGTPPGAGDDVQYVKLDLGGAGISAPAEGTLPVFDEDASGNLTAIVSNVTALNTILGVKADAEWNGVPGSPTAQSVFKRIAKQVELLNTNGVTVADFNASLPVGDNNIGNVDVLTVPAVFTDGTQKSVVRAGAKGVTAAADVTSTAQGVDHQSLDVQIMHGGAAKDPTQIRALTAADAVTIGAALPAGTNNIGDVDVLTLPALPAGTNNIGDVDVLTLPALPAGTNKIGTVDIATAVATAKNTQGANGVPTQDLKDAGRNTRVFMLDAITAAPVADALATVVQWYGNAAVAGTTQPAVIPAGKTLRLLTWKIQYQSLATVGYAVVRVRFNTGGLVVIGSPLVFSFEAGSGAGATTVAMTGGVTTETGCFPEGFELPAGGGIGFSVAGYGPTGTLTLEGGVRFMVCGYEY